MAVLAVAAVAGVALWLFDTPTTGEAAPLTILRPAEGAEVRGSVEVIFETDAPLRLTQRGWVADDLHLHASFDGAELMPAAADIESVGSRRFRWTLPAPAPGERTLRLYWSDLSHEALEEGASAPVRVQVRPGGP